MKEEAKKSALEDVMEGIMPTLASALSNPRIVSGEMQDFVIILAIYMKHTEKGRPEFFSCDMRLRETG